MPRRNRIVIPGLPHHVTQRGVQRSSVFFDEQDREVYFRILKPYAEKYGVDVIAYCLMTNHTHHMLVPYRSDSLRWTMQLTHKQFAEYINAKNGCKGHVWQERFYSSPLDEKFFWITARYIENNPVKAGLVSYAEDYRWSSAAAHVKGEIPRIGNPESAWSKLLLSRAKWSDWLKQGDNPDEIHILRQNTRRDLPSGSTQFLDSLRLRYGIQLSTRKRGRPRKK